MLSDCGLTTQSNSADGLQALRLNRAGKVLSHFRAVKTQMILESYPSWRKFNQKNGITAISTRQSVEATYPAAREIRILLIGSTETRIISLNSILLFAENS